jgi:hypothetical protein
LEVLAFVTDGTGPRFRVTLRLPRNDGACKTIVIVVIPSKAGIQTEGFQKTFRDPEAKNLRDPQPRLVHHSRACLGSSELPVAGMIELC